MSYRVEWTSEFDSNISAAVAPADNPDGKFVLAFSSFGKSSCVILE
jgi:hypothetical protein